MVGCCFRCSSYIQIPPRSCQGTLYTSMRRSSGAYCKSTVRAWFKFYEAAPQSHDDPKSTRRMIQPRRVALIVRRRRRRMVRRARRTACAITPSM